MDASRATPAFRWRHNVVPALLLCAVVAGCATGKVEAPGDEKQSSATALSPQEKQQKIADTRRMRDETLARLIKEKPEVEAEIAKSVGYGVFDGRQINIVLLVGASGYGVLVDNSTRQETFMTMKRLGTGPGVGYKDFHQVIVFKSRALFDQFRTVGADVSAGADATAKLSGRGASLDGTMSFNPQLSVYQITDDGLLLQANWGGVAYLPDSRLND